MSAKMNQVLASDTKHGSGDTSGTSGGNNKSLNDTINMIAAVEKANHMKDIKDFIQFQPENSDDEQPGTKAVEEMMESDWKRSSISECVSQDKKN